MPDGEVYPFNCCGLGSYSNVRYNYCTFFLIFSFDQEKKIDL